MPEGALPLGDEPYIAPILKEIGKNYSFDGQIASGKNGIAYRIKSRQHGHLFCLKTIKPSITSKTDRERVKETLEKEFKILKPLSHRCLPTVYEANFESELPYYVCTYHPGETWNAFRKEDKKLKAEEAYFVIYSLIDAFEYLHKMGRTHCDAHEDNILISDRVFGEGILLIDFGSGHRGSDPSPDTPDRGHAGFKGLEGQIRFQQSVDRKAFAAEFEQYDFKALGRLLALMAPVFCANTTYDQRNAYREFCILLENDGIRKDWEYVKYQFNFVIDPNFLSESTKGLFATKDGKRNSAKIPTSPEIVLGEGPQKVLDTGVFQKLRGIKQLSFCEWAFPGGTHTRLEHSLGVFGITKRALDFLASDPWFKRRFTPNQVRATLLASLVHDVGHYPFAHVIEHYVKSRYSEEGDLRHQIDHLTRTLQILDSDAEMRGAIVSEWGEDGIEECKRVLTGKAGILSKLIDGTVDCDKIDYLKRDAYHCGVPYGSGFDSEEVISAFRCSPDGEEILIDEGFVHSIEGFILAQDQMLSGVYWHGRVRAIFGMFHRYLDVVIGKEKHEARLLDLVHKLSACRSEGAALREVILPLSEAWAEPLKSQLKNLVSLHIETDEKHSYKEIARFDYVDKNDASINPPENIFKTIVMTSNITGYSGPPIIWAKVRRLRGCFFEAIRQKGIKDVGPLDVIVDIPWGKGLPRMVNVIDSERKYAPREITLVSHLAPSFFVNPTAYSAPIRVFLSRDIYYLIVNERANLIQTVLGMFFSRDKYTDDDEQEERPQ